MQSLIASIVAFSAHNPVLLATLAFVAAAAEAIVVVGAAVPGTAILLAVAALAGAQGSTSIAFAIFAAATIGAIAGDGLGFWLGRRYGRDLARVWPLSRYPDWLPRGEAYFQRHGGKSVFWGRFIPGVKTVVPVVAGIGRMPVMNFLLANVTSAVFWSLGFVLGGLGVGRGLDRFGLADPRLVILLVILAFGLALAYGLLRVLLLRGMPVIARLNRQAIGRLERHPGRGARWLRRVLSNDSGAAVALIWAAVSAAALIGFVALLGQVLFDSGFLQADSLISDGVQALRFAALDRMMIGVTMAGDGLVLAILAMSALAWLLVWRQWRAASATAGAFGATMLFVPVMKSMLARERPFALYEGADAFSFPSGHASHAMVVFGVVAILLAHRLNVRARLSVYFAALGSTLLVALSRIYLGAHWPSDVAGGMLFGAAIIAAVGFILRDQPLVLHPRWMALVLLLAYGTAYVIHVDRAYALWTSNYTHRPEVVELAPATWGAGDWMTLPQRRITLSNEPVPPFIAQVAGDPGSFARALEQSGWSLQGTVTQSVLSTLLPYGGLSELSAGVALHDGRLPVATLANASGSDRRRLVLRIWPSTAVLVGETEPPTAISLVDLSAETFTPLAFGFGNLEASPASAVETDAVREQIGNLPGFSPASPVPQSRNRSPTDPLLLTEDHSSAPR